MRPTFLLKTFFIIFTRIFYEMCDISNLLFLDYYTFDFLRIWWQKYLYILKFISYLGHIFLLIYQYLMDSKLICMFSIILISQLESSHDLFRICPLNFIYLGILKAKFNSNVVALNPKTGKVWFLFIKLIFRIGPDIRLFILLYLTTKITQRDKRQIS